MNFVAEEIFEVQVFYVLNSKIKRKYIVKEKVIGKKQQDYARLSISRSSLPVFKAEEDSVDDGVANRLVSAREETYCFLFGKAFDRASKYRNR